MATDNICALNPVDAIDKGISQLGAMLTAIYGGGAEAFNEMSEEARDAYLWACHDKLSDIERAWQAHRGTARR